MKQHSSIEPALAATILAAVDQLHPKQTQFLAQLVQCRSLRGTESGVQRLVASELSHRGYVVTEVPTVCLADNPRFSPGDIPYDESWNLVAALPGSGNGRSLILNAHVDVVPEGPKDRWTHDPFGAEVAGDWMYGRGAGDMKAGLSALIFALDALALAGVRPAGAVQIHSVVEEEITGNGAASILAKGYSADAVLIPEPTDEQLVRANSGVIKFRVTLSGQPAHPRAPETGRSAIDLMIFLLTHLRVLEARWNDRRFAHPGFENLSNPVALTIGTVTGGEWIASLPASCVVEGRVGFYPGELPADRQREFEDFISALAAGSDEFLGCPAPQIEWVGVCQPGYVLSSGGSAELALAAARQVAAGDEAPMPSYVMPCYLDSTLYASYAGIPALVYGPIAENIHGFDERVSLSSLTRTTKTIAIFIAEWCGLEPISEHQSLSN